MTSSFLGDASDDLDVAVRGRTTNLVSNTPETDPVPTEANGTPPAPAGANEAPFSTLSYAAAGTVFTTQYEAPANPTLSDEVTFISGINPDGTLALYSQASWNQNYPATYDGGYTQAFKWFANASSGTAGTPGGTVNYYFDSSSNWTQTERNQLTAGLALWSSVANISFVQGSDYTPNTSSAGSLVGIKFTRGGTGSGAFTTPSGVVPSGAGVTGGTKLLQLTQATISIETTASGFGPLDGSFSTYGGYPWMTLLHEEGHALGLDHGGPYPISDSTPTNAQLQYSVYDTRLWTIMSYIRPNDSSATFYSQYPVAGADFGTTRIDATHFTYNVPTTLMPLDILAIQRLYGAPSSTLLSGNQTFGFGSNIPDPLRNFFVFQQSHIPAMTIWSSGSNNTLDADAFDQNAVINLNPGTFSSIGGGTNNVAIAFNTRIDTVTGGGGNDTITANNNGDTIYGLGGNDTLLGGSGDDTLMGGQDNDTIDGGAGTDIAVFSNNYSDYTITATASGYTVAANFTGAFSELTDTITNVEFFKFKDGTVAAGAPPNSAPVVAGAGNTVSYTEQGAAVPIAPGLTVGDANNATLSGATITITSPFTPGDLLNFTNQNGITGTYSGVATLTLSGNASLANYQAALRSITFTSSSDNPDFYGSWLTRTVSWQVDDGAGVNHASNTVTSTINITAVNDAPTLSGAGNTVSYAASGTATVIDSALTISDPDNNSFTGARVTISSGYVSGDALNFTNQNGISGTYSAASHILTLSGNAAFASYQTALRSITFSSSNADPSASGASASRTISWELNDNSALSPAVTSTVNIVDNVAPTLASTSPVDNARDIAIGSNIVLNFSEAVKAGSGNILIRRSSNDAIAATLSVTDTSQVSFSGSTLTLNPSADLLRGTGYYVTLPSGAVTDLAGNAYAGIASNTAFNFTTLGRPRSDFDGDGKSDVSWQNTLSGQVTLWQMNGTTVQSSTSLAGVGTGWQAVAADDFNGDGKADVLWQAGDKVAMWQMNGGSIASGAVLVPTAPADSRLVGTGDFDGDGKADLLWQNTLTGQITVWQMSGTTVQSSTSLAGVGTGWQAVAADDFNGDGKADVLWQAGDKVAMWQMNGGSIASGAVLVPTAPADSRLAGTGDFDGDGKADLLWQNTLTGQITLWQMNGTTVQSSTSLAGVGTGWQAVAAADYNGDGKADVLWQAGDKVAMWQMNGGSIASGAVLVPTAPADARLFPSAGAAARKDFNGDGKADVLWQNSGTSEVMLWEMNGASVQASTTRAGVGTGWQAVATADFSGDGKADMLWKADDKIGMWLMNGSGVVSAAVLGTAAPVNGRLVGTGDFNGDGKADVLWQNTVTGDVTLWEMNGTSVQASTTRAGVGTGWQAVATADFSGDGKADILWKADDKIGMWLMNGSGVVSASVLGTAAPVNGRLVGTGDFNGDGKADVLWQNTVTGDVTLWEMNGASVQASTTRAGVGTGWQAASVGDYSGDGKADILWQADDKIGMWLMNGSGVASASVLSTTINPNSFALVAAGQ